MKKLHFGYDNSSHPFGGVIQEGLGLTKNGKLIGPIYGELVDVINVYDENYIIYKVVEAFDHDENYIGKYEVRRALVDMFANGSGILFVDKRKDYNSEKLEKIINFDSFLNRLANGEDFINILEVVKSNSYAFDGALNMKAPEECARVCAIDHEVFEHKKALLKRCLSSITDMQEKLERKK